MSRQKQEIKKSVDFTIRVEPTLKKQYFCFCKKNNYVLSKRIRELILNDLEKQ